MTDQPPMQIAGELVAVTICYEDVFGAEQLHYLPDATLLVNVSNDAWFGDSIAPHQHLQIARVRAAEAGRYLLRATNTGVTAIIDPHGAHRHARPAVRARGAERRGARLHGRDAVRALGQLSGDRRGAARAARSAADHEVHDAAAHVDRALHALTG